MDLKIQRNDNTAFLSGDLTIYTVSSLCDTYRDSLFTVCDLSSVSRIDTAGFQALLFIKREGSALNEECKFVKVPEEVDALFSLYGETL